MFSSLAFPEFFCEKSPGMIEFTTQALRRLLAILALTGALSQGQAADPDAVQRSQFPWYAALTQAEQRFDETLYLGSNAVIFLDKHDTGDGVLRSPYLFAELYIPDVHALRAWYADDPALPQQGVSTIGAACQTVGAAFAVNGDFYTAQGVTAIRNGTILNSCVSTYDLCVLYEDGQMRTFHGRDLPTQDDVNEALRGAWQAWSFGPALLDEDGGAISDFTGRTIEYLTRDHARTAIGYYGPGHYCLVNVAGYRSDMPGATLEELSAFFAAQGCRCAYNLDGGSSAHLWFHGRELGYPSAQNYLADLIYLEDLVTEGAAE